MHINNIILGNCNSNPGKKNILISVCIYRCCFASVKIFSTNVSFGWEGRGTKVKSLFGKLDYENL